MGIAHRLTKPYTTQSHLTHTSKPMLSTSCPSELRFDASISLSHLAFLSSLPPSTPPFHSVLLNPIFLLSPPSPPCPSPCHSSPIHRWAQLRTAMIPFPTLLEPFSECLLLGFLASLCARYVMGVPFVVFYSAHILVWMVFDFFLLKNLQVSYIYYYTFML